MSFTLRVGNIFAVPITHYNMEMAAQVVLAFKEINPDCVAVELAETMQLQLLHAASRLPDISVVTSYDQKLRPIHYLAEPCEPTFEGLRLAIEESKDAYCIDLDVDEYPDYREAIPDSYALTRIGLKRYYELYKMEGATAGELDQKRELYMARKLKELSFRYDKILFVGGMAHTERILAQIGNSHFPDITHKTRQIIEVATLSEKSCGEVLAENAWFSSCYESERSAFLKSTDSCDFPPDRNYLLLRLYRAAAANYQEKYGERFERHHLRNTMKFTRNMALLSHRLMPNTYQMLIAAKGCVDHNFAYEAWRLASEYEHLKNVDNLPVKDLSIEQIWGHSKKIHFHLRQKSPKQSFSSRREQERAKFKFSPPGPFSICSYPPEDVVIENFGQFLKKKGTHIQEDELARVSPFTASLEDGIDMRETIRHKYEGKLYVRINGKPPGSVGSIVVIFDEDCPPDEQLDYIEKYYWKTTWQGEHEQESDMAFYATPMRQRVVGPGISRSEYGGFMMSYPPRRMHNVWGDPEYRFCKTKPEVLLAAAIDYAVQSVIVYVGTRPPRQLFKSIAGKFEKKIIYIPIGQLSPVTLKKIRSFHVLDGHDKRSIADEFID